MGEILKYLYTLKHTDTAEVCWQSCRPNLLIGSRKFIYENAKEAHLQCEKCQNV